MTYGIRLSGTPLSNVEDALETHFRYDSDANYGARNIDTMTEEIQWLRPLEFGGIDYQNGPVATVGLYTVMTRGPTRIDSS